MGNIYFNYKNNKYKIFFYPCGNIARVENINTKNIREIKLDKNIKVSNFLEILEKIF